MASRVPAAPMHDALVALPRQDLRIEIRNIFRIGIRAGGRKKPRANARNLERPTQEREAACKG